MSEQPKWRRSASLQTVIAAASHLVRRAVFALVLVVSTSVSLGIYSYTRLDTLPQVHAATSSTLNFQARLLSSSGNTVPDGYYNVEFKLYNVSSGGSALWTETRDFPGTDDRVRVVNGYFSVNLGSVTSFPSTINWDQEHWITMNIGGSTTSPAWDGEMTPRLKLTAVPYAFTAGALQKQTGGANTTGTLEFATLTADRKFIIPDTTLATTASPGTICVFNGTSSNCPAATGSAFYIQNTTTTQSAANFNIQSAAAGSVGGVIKGAASQTADLFQLQDSTGAILTAFQADGKLVFGPSGSQDTNLYRSAANTLKTDDALVVGGTTGTDSTSKFQVVNAAGVAHLNVDTTNSITSFRGINSVATLGSEKVTNGTFTGNATGWTLGTGWAYNSNNVTKTAGTASDLEQNVSSVNGETYKVTFTISGWTAGCLTPEVGGVSGNAVCANSTGQTQIITATGTGNLKLKADSTFAGTIDDVSVMRITNSNTVLQVRNSDDSIGLEVRAGGTSLNNSFIGVSAGQSNTTGSSNTALGSLALQSNTTGARNTAIGYNTLKSNTTGNSNVAIGPDALRKNTSGFSNIALGWEALYDNTTGSNNIALGTDSLISNTTGSSNIALGTDALANNRTGSQNLALGQSALGVITSGASNIGLGYTAGDSISTGSGNTLLGHNSDVTSATLQNATAIGINSVVSQNDSLVLGCINGTNGCTATTKVGIGDAAPSTLLSLGGTGATNGITLGDDAANPVSIFRSAADTLGIGASIAQFTEVAGTRTLTVETRTTNAAGSGLTVSGGAAGAGGSAFTGGTLTLQGGNAAGTGNANGANVVIQGGSGVGTGVQGLVTLAASAFTASSTQSFGSNGTISQAVVDSNSTIPINATAASLTITLPAPTNTAVGRIVYITAVSGSNSYTISPSGGTAFVMSANMTATFVWNGTAWTNAGVDGGSASYIQNQNSTDQTANFRISGTGQANTSYISPLFKSLDSSGGGNSANVIFQSGDQVSGSGTSGSVTLTSGSGTSGNRSSGNVSIDVGAKSGTGTTGTLSIGTTNASAITIGNATSGLNLAVSTAQFTEVTGTRTLTVQTRTTNVAGSSLTVQGGTAGTGGSAFTGGTLTLQGGNAAGTGNANGANVVLRGGTGVGTGVSGIVEIDTPVFTASSTQTFGSNGTISQAVVDSNSTIPVNATAGSLTITLPAPTNTTVGRIIYVTSVNGSNSFTIAPSGGTNFVMNANMSGTFIWNGVGWTNAGVDGGSNSYIQNQNAVQQTANYRISGTGQADTGFLGPNLERATAGTLSVGTTANTTAISVGRSGITTTNAGALTVSELLTGNLGATISGATINLNATSNFATNINTGTSTGAVSIGNSLAGAINLQSASVVNVNNTSGVVALSVDTVNAITSLRGLNSAAVVSGTEKVTNGTFTGNATGWTLGTGWAYNSNNVTKTAGTASDLEQNVSAVNGETYRIQFTVSAWSAGCLYAEIGGVGSFSYVCANSTTQTQIITATGTGNLKLKADASFAGTIDDVSVRLVSTSNSVLNIQNSNGTTGIEIRGGGITNYNTFVGLSSGRANVSAAYGTALGAGALQSNTTGATNTAIGAYALTNSTTGQNNTAVGGFALEYNTTGQHNNAFGFSALDANTTGNHNTAIGRFALSGNFSGSNNVALGNSAGDTITSGSGNTLLGYNSDVTVATLQNAGAIGINSVVSQNDSLVLGCISGINSCTANTKVGIGIAAPTSALDVLGATTGSDAALTVSNNTSTGSIALFKDNTTTVATIADGGAVTLQNVADTTAAFTVNRVTTSTTDVLKVDTTNSITSLRGINTSASAGSEKVTNGTFTGNATGWTLGTGWAYNSNNVTKTAGTASDLEQDVSAVNGESYRAIFSISSWTAGCVRPEVGGVAGTYICANSSSQTQLITATGTGNLKLHADSSFAATVDTVSVMKITAANAILQVRNSSDAVSLEVRGGNTSSVYIGLDAGRNAITANYNVALGSYAMYSNTTGLENTAIGNSAMYYNTSGRDNTAIGASALNLNTTGSDNISIGPFSLSSNTTGSSNTALGRDAGNTNTTGSGNTLLGYNSDVTVNSLQNATAIGINSVVSQNDSLVLGCISGTNGCTATTSVGIGTAAPSAILHTVAAGAKTANYSGNLLTNTATSSTNSITKAGLEVTSTGTWNGTSANNIGIYVSSVTGGTNNYDAIFNGAGINSKVGIGTTAPTAGLHVKGNEPQIKLEGVSTGASNTAYMMFVDSAGTGTGSFGDKVTTDSDIYLMSNANLNFQVGGANTLAYLDGTAFYLGNGATSTSPTNFGLQATGGSGANIAGATLTIAGGQGTGSAVGGNILFRYSPAGGAGSSLNALQTACSISGTNGSFSCPGSGADSERFGSGTVASHGSLAIGYNASANYGVNGYSVALGSSAAANGQQSVAVGQSAVSSGSNSIAIGTGSTVSGGNTSVIGQGASSNGNGNIVLGQGATANNGGGNQFSVVLGYLASSTAQSAIALGQGTTANNTSAIAIGAGATTTAANQLVIGSSGSAIQNAFIGNGVTNAAPTAFTLQGTGSSTAGTAGAAVTLKGGAGTTSGAGSTGGAITLQAGNSGGSNVVGGNTIIAGGAATGNATGGAIIFNTADPGGSGSTVQTLTEKGRITSVGRLQLSVQGVTGGLLIGTDANLYRSAADTLKTDDTFEAASGFRLINLTRTVPTTVNDAVDIGSFGGSFGGNIYDISVVVSDSGFSLSKSYRITAQYDFGSVWQTALPLTDSGPWGTDNIALDVRQTTGTTDFRIRRTSGSTAGTARVTIQQLGTNVDAFTASTATSSVSAPATVAYSTAITQALGTVTVRGYANSANAFQLQNASGQNLMVADTSNQRLAIGPAAVPANGVLTVGTDTTAASGGIYFGTDTNLYRSAADTLKTDDSLIVDRNTGGDIFAVRGGGGNIISVQGQGSSGLQITDSIPVRFGSSGASIYNSGTALTITNAGNSGNTNYAVAGGSHVFQGTAGASLLTISGATGDVALSHDLAVNGGDITSTAATVNVLTNANPTTINIGTGSVARTTTLGSADTTSTTTIQAGSGNINFNASRAQFTEVAGTRTLTAQTRTTNAAGTAITISAGTAGAGGSAFSGGLLTLQGGSAAGTGSANGGAVTIAGGAAVGTGTQGLVNLATSAFTSASEQAFTSSTSITAGNVDLYSALPVKANTNTGLVLTVPDPAQNVVGRLLYISARSGSLDFTMRLNAARTPIDIAMKANSTATLIWNGTDWTAAGASSSTDLQSAYNNTLTSAGGAEVVLNASGGAADGLTVRNNATTPIIGGIFEAQTSIGSNLLSVNNNAVEYATNGGAETQGASASTFPANTWDTTTGGTVDRYTTAGDNIATGVASVRVQTTTTNHGARNRISATLISNQTYSVSFAVRGATNFSTLQILYSPDGTTSGTTQCATAQTVNTGKWSRILCTFVASGTITSSNSMLIRQTDGTARTFYLENLSVSANASANFAADGDVDNAGAFGTNWTAYDGDGGGAGTSSAARDTAVLYNTSASARADTSNHADMGIRNNLAITPQVSTQYLVSFYARSGTGSISDLTVRYSRDGGTDMEACADYNTQAINTTSWTKITCLVTTDVTTASNPDLIFTQATAPGGTRSIYIDALSVTIHTNNSNNVQIGGANKGGPTTLLTLDRASTAPIAANNDAYLGSMYYDTTTGRIQCYEADGWGACGSAPDNIVVLTPEYTGAVLNGNGVGTLTADFCANQTSVLVVGSLCASGNSRQFYNWTSPQATSQLYSIYVSYKLPTTFKSFNSDDTINLTARTSNTTNGSVKYEVFRSTGSAITACGTETDVTNTTDGANFWSTKPINGNEQTSCGFQGGDNIIFKINVRAMSSANVYVENLTFTYSNN